MKKVITFGEVMLRLSTPGHARFIQAENFEATYGGGEANVAISLARFGLKSSHITRFPDNPLGQAAANLLRKYGVNTDGIIYGGDRIGLYFLENGSSVRPSRIIYDRSASSFSQLEPGMIDWSEIMKDADWFHWTGITPAISEGAALCCKEAIETANKKGIPVSADINYRQNLWQYGKKPSEVMPELISGCDLLVAGTNDALNSLGIVPQEGEDPNTSVFRQIMNQFPKVKKIVTTKRDSHSASHNTLSGQLYDGTTMRHSQSYEIQPIVDRVGGGDAFIAGIIYGELMYGDGQKTLDFGVAASVLKHTIENDANLSTPAEVENLMLGDTTGRIIR